jgi:hypothetical protein
MADMTSKMGGLGVVSEKVSTFDGATIVEVSPQFVHDPKHTGWGFNSYKLGARWNSNSPEYVALIMSYSSSADNVGSIYTSLTGIDVNLNGQKYSFEAGGATSHGNDGWNDLSKTIYTNSQNTVVVPLEFLQEMTVTEDCTIRIHSSDGYEDALFSMERRPGGQGLALMSIREFLSKVKNKRQILAADDTAGSGG